MQAAGNRPLSALASLSLVLTDDARPGSVTTDVAATYQLGRRPHAQGSSPRRLPAKGLSRPLALPARSSRTLAGVRLLWLECTPNRNADSAYIRDRAHLPKCAQYSKRAFGNRRMRFHRFVRCSWKRGDRACLYWSAVGPRCEIDPLYQFPKSSHEVPDLNANVRVFSRLFRRLAIGRFAGIIKLKVLVFTRKPANGRGLSEHFDKLGVTGSSPVAPTRYKSTAERNLQLSSVSRKCGPSIQESGDIPGYLGKRSQCPANPFVSLATESTLRGKPVSPSTARTISSAATDPPRARKPRCKHCHGPAAFNPR